MSPCTACRESEAGPSGLFISGCLGCQARAASRSPHFHASAKAGRLTAEYRDLLQRMGLTHEQVRAARVKDCRGSNA